MSTEQQYRVTGKSGPGVEPVVGMVVRHGGADPKTITHVSASRVTFDDDTFCLRSHGWDFGDYEILEAISPPQAATVACKGKEWCGRRHYGHVSVPPWWDMESIVVAEHPLEGGVCFGDIDACYCEHLAYCTQACLDRAKGTKAAAPTCIRSACKAHPVAGGELCVAHAEQVEAAKTGTASAARCGHAGPLSCGKCADCTAAPVPAPAETRLGRWRREHKGYGQPAGHEHDSYTQEVMMRVGLTSDLPNSGWAHTDNKDAKPDPWTPREVDMDIPDAHELGGTRLGRR